MRINTEHGSGIELVIGIFTSYNCFRTIFFEMISTSTAIIGLITLKPAWKLSKAELDGVSMTLHVESLRKSIKVDAIKIPYLASFRSGAISTDGGPTQINIEVN